MADELALDGSMIDSVTFVTVKSRSTGKKSLIPPSSEATFEVKTPVGTPVSLRRSVKRDEMLENFWNRSDDPDGCWPADAELLTVVSCVILVVARTLLIWSAVSVIRLRAWQTHWRIYDSDVTSQPAATRASSNCVHS